MDYRNTNIEEIGMSPSQLFLDRRIKTDMPVTTPLLLQSPSGNSEIKSRMKLCKDQYKFYYDKHAGNQLRPLREGENVIMQRGKE